jgi:hypothetical protein
MATNPPSVVTVSRADFVAAVRFVGHAGGKKQGGPATLSVKAGTLRLERIGLSQEMPVSGPAEFVCQFALNFALFAPKIPDQDPLEISFDGTHLCLHRYRHPAMVPRIAVLDEAFDEKERLRRINRAAAALGPYFVTAADLLPICGDTSMFSEGEQPMTERIAQAWAELAPYGVTPEDVKLVVSEKLRNAWRR